MKMMDYSDPLRGEERSMNPEFAQHQMRDPGLKTIRPHISTGLKPPHMGGLGSMHHTMPHLRRFGMPHFQVGGLNNAVGELLGPSTMASGANDSQYRQFLHLIGQTPVLNRSLTQMPSNSASFGYAGGGAAQPDPQDVEQPDEEMSPGDQQEKQIVLNAMAALDGQSPNPEQDIAAFIDAFGPQALKDLQQLVETHHQEQQQGGGEDEEDQEGSSPSEPADGGGSQSEPGDDEDQEQEAATDLQGGQMGQAGGGLLHGRGTGQSDEIEATTPSGHPVLLSDGEYVIDAPTVAALGDGSTKAGARRLDEMRKQIRKSAYGHEKQAKPMKASGGGVVIKLK